MKTNLLLAFGLAATIWATPVAAQTYTPPKFNYSYGYQPYNDRNPTGFNHPNDTGYGHYIYSPKTKGRRVPALAYRRFKGY